MLHLPIIILPILLILDNDYSGNNLPGTAKETWLLMAILNLKKNTGLTIWHRYTGKMPLNDANSGYSDAFWNYQF